MAGTKGTASRNARRQGGTGHREPCAWAPVVVVAEQWHASWGLACVCGKAVWVQWAGKVCVWGMGCTSPAWGGEDSSVCGTKQSKCSSWYACLGTCRKLSRWGLNVRVGRCWEGKRVGNQHGGVCGGATPDWSQQGSAGRGNGGKTRPAQMCGWGCTSVRGELGVAG